MAEQHPKLRFRPKPKIKAKRPTMQHPVLGTMEYINRDGGWWQGKADIAGTIVRLDLQKGTKVTEEERQSAARFLEWIQNNESTLREHVKSTLEDGKARSNMTAHSNGVPELDEPEILDDLRPSMVVLWDDQAELHYDCDSIPNGNLFGAQRIEVDIDRNFVPIFVRLLDLSFRTRAEMFFDRQLPEDVIGFEGSLGDQLIASAAEGTLSLDAELRKILRQAIQDASHRIRSSSSEGASYLTSAKVLLSELAATGATTIIRVSANFYCEHATEPISRFKEQLKLSKDDGVDFSRADRAARVAFLTGGSSSVAGIMLFEDYADEDEFAKSLRDRLKNAAVWFAKQSPMAFDELRKAGYLLSIRISVLAKIGDDTLQIDLPSEFLLECGRHGLELHFQTDNWTSDLP